MWRKLYYSTIFQHTMSEYFHLYELYQIIILGYMKEKRVFSAQDFVTISLQNILDKNLENYL